MAKVKPKKKIKRRKIAFSFESSDAKEVNLVGDFNDWDRESLPFRQNREGNWGIEVELEAGRKYRFRYLLDGEHWRDDWHADEFVSNPLGGYDSIIIAEVPPEA